MYVLESSGSSPGRQGFFMAVNDANKMAGSLGGGIMEHKFVELAKSKLAAHALEASVHRQVHDKSAPKHQSGMICSGEQTIFMYVVREKDMKPIEGMVRCLEQNRNGTFHLTQNGIGFDDRSLQGKTSFVKHNDEEFEYAQRIGYADHLYIVGGGHCALALSRLMATMDFYIHVYDDRPELNTMQQNEYAHERTVVDDYNALVDFVPSGESSYVVVMTFGYRTDDIAVRALMHKDFKYFGLLGSKKKIEKMFSDYRAEGIPEERLSRILAPVGVFIKSETPEEIAVSIAAEIIGVKNRPMKGVVRGLGQS